MLSDFVSIAIEFGLAVVVKIHIMWAVILVIAFLVFIFGWKIFKAKYLRG